MMFNTTVADSAITARIAGFLYQGRANFAASLAIPQHNPSSSDSGLGLVKNEISTVAKKQAHQAMVARQKLPAMTDG